MQIHSHGNNLKAHFLTNQTATPSGSAAGVGSGGDVARTNETNPKRLLEQLESGKTLRTQLLAEITAKINAGEYQTRAAAVEAAEQIVGF